MFSLGVIDFGVLPWGLHCGAKAEYLGVCVWGVCAHARVCAQIVRKLHIVCGGASGPLGVRVLTMWAHVGVYVGLCDWLLRCVGGQAGVLSLIDLNIVGSLFYLVQ